MAAEDIERGDAFFKFPFEPYKSQLRLMQQIYEVCEHGKIGICESPTGTGKSLSIICAIMRWLEDYEQRETSEYEAMKKSVDEWQKRVTESGASIPFDEFAREHRRVRDLTEKLVELAKQFERRDAIEKYRSARVDTLAELEKASAKFGGAETDLESEQLEALFGEQVDPDEKDEAQFANLENGAAEQDALDDGQERARAHRVTVYYASRTHSQLAQFLGELRRTEYAQRANVVVLGSRQALCVNDSVRRLEQLSLINDACNDLLDSKKQRTATSTVRRKVNESGGDEAGKKPRGVAVPLDGSTQTHTQSQVAGVQSSSKADSRSGCRFYKKSAVETLARYALTHVTDIEDLCRTGRHQAVHACPYFASKWAARDAQLVLVPYAVVFNARMRRSFGLQLRDAVLVVDEAHNLLEALAALNSATVSHAQLVSVGDALRAYAARYQKRIAPRNLVAIRQLTHITEQLAVRLTAFASTSAQSSAEVTESAESVNTFLFATKIDNLNLFELVRFAEQSRFWHKLFGFARSRFYHAPSLASRSSDERPGQPSTAASQSGTSNLTAFLQSLQPTPRPTKSGAAANTTKSKSKLPANAAAASGSTSAATASPGSGEPTAELTMSCLLQFESLLRALTNADQDGRIILKRSPSENRNGNQNTVLVKYVLLNPTDCLVDILRETRALVLCGGTMKPTGELVHLLSASLSATHRRAPASDQNANAAEAKAGRQLETRRDAPKQERDLDRRASERIVEFSCEHVIPADQLAIFVVSECAFAPPSATTFDFTFANRRDEHMIAQLATLVERVCAVVPGGVVVFFQSYDYLDTIYTAWRTGGALRRIESHKPVLREPKQSNELDALLHRYTSLIQPAVSRGTQRGALLLSVVGGKLSEGINFADELGRCVIVVGLPFPNVRSAELKERVAYLNAHAAGLSGAEHCENVCMRAVNQSIGRAIRHRNDYASILLIDQRFTRAPIREKLPGWMQPSLQRYAARTRFDDTLVADMRTFFDAMAKRFANTSKVGKTG